MDTLHKINALLVSHNKSQKELCEYLGVQNTTFTKWKAGTNTSYKKYIGKIADYFGVTSDYLLGLDTKEKNLSEKDRLIAEINDKLYGMDSDKLLAFRDMLAAFVQAKGK